MPFKSIKTAALKDKKVLIRADFNVPLKKGKVQDNKRIKAALPTLKYILSRDPKQIILMSHLGRPKGKVKDELRMDPVAKELEKLLKRKVAKLDDCIDADVPDDKVILLENLRFHKEEKKDSKRFAKKLASIADVYVNDAFGTSHRKHASVHAITKYLPSYPGMLLKKEIDVMGKAITKPARPFIAVLGGAKVSDKIEVINNLLKKVDVILIGGAMMFTFYKAMGKETGKSLVEEDKISLAKKLIRNSKNKLVLPIDTVAADKIDQKSKTKTAKITNIPKSMKGVDIGPDTVAIYRFILQKARTIIWNGPMGVFEIPKFSKGTKEMAKIIADNKKATTIVGGGDSASAVRKFGFEDKYTHVSTGGGASLDLLAGKKLPAVEALKD